MAGLDPAIANPHREFAKDAIPLRDNSILMAASPSHDAIGSMCSTSIVKATNIALEDQQFRADVSRRPLSCGASFQQRRFKPDHASKVLVRP
jgi:hypothetical protein